MENATDAIKIAFAVIYPEFGSVAKVTLYVFPAFKSFFGNVTGSVGAACVAPASKSFPKHSWIYNRG